MEKIKTIVDREPIGSDYIEAKQNFGDVLSQVKNLKPPVWKSAWFYGPIGTAIVAVTLAFYNFNPSENLADPTRFEELTASFSPTSFDMEPSLELAVVNEPEEQPPTENIVVVETEELPTERIAETEEALAELPEDVVESDPIQEEAQLSIESSRPYVSPTNMFPHIEGIFKGEIPFATLCSPNGIEVNDNIHVIAFDITYISGNGTTETASVSGNKIPEYVCSDVQNRNANYELFITDIRGVNNDGRVITLHTMKLRATN
ncbi:MAG: hypothetical protein QNK23_10990 [Crocinitomicaceae bacterium]|nr:hypothetical protein [Crocinitomicaceae bacterium]